MGRYADGILKSTLKISVRPIHRLHWVSIDDTNAAEINLSHDSSPQGCFNAPLSQLQRTLLDYTSRYDPRFYNFTLNGAVLHILQRKDVPGGRVNLSISRGLMKEIYIRPAVIGGLRRHTWPSAWTLG